MSTPNPQRTDGPIKCTWHLGTQEPSPHFTVPVKPEPRVLDSILQHIGNTPLVRINKIATEEGLECEVYAKCEFFNAGGSVKDRIALRMVEEAEKSGRLKPGDTLIEPTSGNTGIGLALAAAVKGYRCIITLPEKMSQEKVDVLTALGAEIIRTPTEAAWDAPDSHIGVARRLNKEIPNSHILDQYINPGNPLAHYDGTGEEILLALNDDVDMVVVGAGTGGTITGIARKIKERCPKCIIVGVDPHGSILAEPASLNGEVYSYQVEGIGYDFIPTVLDRSLVDKWYKSSDAPSFHMSRRLIKSEGLLCGGSSGTNMHYALIAAKEMGMKKGQRVVVLLPDSVRNYMTKFLSNSWMEVNGFLPPPAEKDLEWWESRRVADLRLQKPITITENVSVSDAFGWMERHGIDQVPVLAEKDNAILGVITEGNLHALLASGRVKKTDPVVKAVFKKINKVAVDTTLRELSLTLNSVPFALVVSSQVSCGSGGSQLERQFFFGVVTRFDLLNFIVNGRGGEEKS